jgi:Cu/Ag efflux protein CusF
MKIINLPAVFAASLLLATTAFAASMSTSGVVKSVDTKHDSITLMDGSSYTLGEGFEAETFKAGEKVAIVFVKKNGKMMASSVKAVK